MLFQSPTCELSCKQKSTKNNIYWDNPIAPPTPWSGSHTSYMSNCYRRWRRSFIVFPIIHTLSESWPLITLTPAETNRGITLRRLGKSSEIMRPIPASGPRVMNYNRTHNCPLWVSFLQVKRNSPSTKRFLPYYNSSLRSVNTLLCAPKTKSLIRFD